MKCASCGSEGPFKSVTWQILLNQSKVNSDGVLEHEASIEWVGGFMPNAKTICIPCGSTVPVESFDDRSDAGEMPMGIWSPAEALADYDENPDLLHMAMVAYASHAMPNS